VWVEDGHVYSLGSGTPKKVSLKQLRATAAGLDPLEREYIGSFYDQERGDFSGVLVTTRHTVTGHVDWGSQCTANGTATTPYAGSADFAVLRRTGNAFGFAIPPYLPDSTPYRWEGSVSGTVSPNAIVLNIRATGTFDGSSCDSGPVSVTLDQRAQL
jgi:hypothetical protein